MTGHHQRTSRESLLRQLGHELRILRKARRMSARDVEQATGGRITQSKLSRIEVGRAYRTSTDDVLDLMHAYGFRNPSDFEPLVELARLAREPSWWAEYAAVLPEAARWYLGQEWAAERVRIFRGGQIPGICQTPEYGRALLAVTDPVVSEGVNERRVRARIGRQDALRYDFDPLCLEAVFDATALQREVGGREVMAAQLDYLAELAELPNVTVLIAPADRAYPGLDQPIMILRYTESSGGGGLAVSVGPNARVANVEDPEALAECDATFDALMAACYDAATSLSMIRTAADSWR